MMLAIYDTNTVTPTSYNAKNIFLCKFGRVFFSCVNILNFNSLILQRSGLRQEKFSLVLALEFPEGKNFFIFFNFFLPFFCFVSLSVNPISL